jgi:uncharacterized protein (TIGR02117 family)
LGRAFARFLRGLLLAAGACAVVLAVAALALRRAAEPALFPARDGGVPIVVVDHGYHAGLVLPRDMLAEIAGDERLERLAQAVGVFSAYDHVEIGWGEDRFYRFVPVANIASAHHILRALFNPFNDSVLHVVGVNGDPAMVFARSAPLTLMLSAEGLRRIARELDRQLAPDAAGRVEPAGQGLYGPSTFFAARDRYHILNTCNHWAGRTLELAGLPYAPVEATLSAGLMFDLRRRAAR